MSMKNMRVLAPLLLLTLLLPPAWTALTQRYDDDITPHQLRLEDLEQEQETQELHQPPALPTHYDWQPGGAASLPAAYVRDAAQLERLRQLQLQHQQLSAGYALPPQLSNAYLLLAPTATPPAFDGPSAVSRPQPGPLLKPTVPYGLAGVQYIRGNALELEPPVAPPRLPVHLHGYPYAAPPRPSQSHATLVLQSKQFAYAPPPSQRHYAHAARIPLPYPPSFVSITTRRPQLPYAQSYAKPFRASQPDPTPDLFAGRASKSLLDSYIPSWEVLRLLQRHKSSSHGPYGNQQHTLAYPLRLYKRDSAAAPEQRRIVKKSLSTAKQ